MARKTLIQVRRDTAANWTSTNPTLAAGELGLETDTGNVKAGDGSTAWTSLDTINSGTYVPSEGDALWVPSHVFSDISGATSTTFVGTYTVRGLGANLNEALGTMVELPDWWNTYDVDLYWTNLGADSGDVRWRLDRQTTAAAGDLSAAATTGTNNYLAAPTQNILEVDTIESGLSVTGSTLVALKMWRIGGDAADTLENEAGLLGLMLRRAS